MKRNKKSKTIFDERYERLIASLVAIRKSKGLSQFALSTKSGFDTCFIGRVETRERRLDILELVDYCRALDVTDDEIMKLVQSVMND
jgi:transcriptional regulator with XRE-family HTH domain